MGACDLTCNIKQNASESAASLVPRLFIKRPGYEASQQLAFFLSLISCSLMTSQRFSIEQQKLYTFISITVL